MPFGSMIFTERKAFLPEVDGREILVVAALVVGKKVDRGRESGAFALSLCPCSSVSISLSSSSTLT